MEIDTFDLFQTIYSLILPEEYLKEHYRGELYGVYNEKTGIFNVINPELGIKDERIHRIGSIKDELASSVGEDLKDCICGEWTNDNLQFFYKGKQIEYKTYSIHSDITSRNKGIVDNLFLKDSYAVIVGCGSVGSLVALELARCGVGNFVLVDNDIFAYHNISRHQCGVLDVGKRKVDAIEERIKQINPVAHVKTYFNVIQDVFVDELKSPLLGKNGVIINCGDNRLSSYYSNDLAIQLNMYFISACAAYMASYGELFWYIPGQDLPCYGCIYGDNYNVTNNNETIRHWYADEEQLAKESFIPALSVDIDYISIIAIKYAIDLLMLKSPNYKPRYLQYSTSFMFVSNYLLEQANSKAFGIDEPLQIVKTKTAIKHDCPLCQKYRKT